MRSSAQRVALLTLVLALTACEARRTTAPPAPANLARVSGHGQTGAAGQALTQPLVVAVTSATGAAVAGIAVGWTVAAGQGAVSASSTTTDAQGHASVSLTLGPQTGADVDTVMASVAGLTGSPVVFVASATAGPATQLTLVSGNAQSATVGDTLPARLVVAAQDQFGNPVSGVGIAWTVTGGGGSVSSASVNTDAQGLASVVWTLGHQAGTGNNSTTAGAPGLSGSPVSFTASATAGPATQVVVVSGDNQTGAVGTVLADSLVAVAQDQFGNPAGGVVVIWTVTAGGGALSVASAVTDAQGRSAVTWTLGDSLGTQHATAELAGVGSPATFTATAGSGGAAQLVFSVQPSSVGAGSPVTPPVQVTALDAFGDTAAGFAGTVTVALGANPGGATLTGTLAVTAVAGVATFSDLTLDKVGSGYTLVASATGIPSATSTTFNVLTDGGFSRLVFTVQPTSATAGAAITPAIQVTAQDNFGNTATSFTGDVTLSIGSNPGGASLSGTTTVAAVSGVATFSGLSLDKVGNGYTLIASATGVTSATSTAFDVAPGAASLLAFTMEPASTTAGATLGTVQVSARDGFGNTATTFAGAVTVTLGANPGGATLSGTTTVTTAAGVASFSDLSLDRPGTGYTLTATASGLAADTSATFDIAPGSATQLVFTVEPTNADTGAAITPAVEVTARDSLGNTATAFTGTVTITIASNPAGGTLSGTASAPASAGVVTFANLHIDKAGAGYTLQAGANGLTAATSTTFDITVPPPAGSVVIAAGDAQSGLQGYALNVAPAVLVRDTLNAPLAGVPVAFAVASGGGSVTGGTTTTDVNGIATVGAWSVQLGSNTLTATVGAPGFTGNPVSFAATGVAAGYHIDVRFLTTMTPSQQAAFTNAAAKWETLIYGDVPDVPVNVMANACAPNTPALNETIDDIVIFASIDSIDGPGKILGQAGPCGLRPGSLLPFLGVMMFDSADVAGLETSGQLGTVILHEMGHVLGYGTIWGSSFLNLLSGAGGTDPHFIGAQALAAFDANGGQSYTAGAKVPVENCVSTPGPCGSGTQDAHWRESVFDTELMTGYLNSGVPNPLSVITTASMGDLGYTVNYAGSDPYTVVNPLAALRAPAGPVIELRDDILHLPLFTVDAAGRLVKVLPVR